MRSHKLIILRIFFFCRIGSVQTLHSLPSENGEPAPAGWLIARGVWQKSFYCLLGAQLLLGAYPSRLESLRNKFDDDSLPISRSLTKIVFVEGNEGDFLIGGMDQDYPRHRLTIYQGFILLFKKWRAVNVHSCPILKYHWEHLDFLIKIENCIFKCFERIHKREIHIICAILMTRM